jgi:hypothetical protein
MKRFKKPQFLKEGFRSSFKRNSSMEDLRYRNCAAEASKLNKTCS